MSWLQQCLSFALKSPIATSKYGLFSDNFAKANSKFCENDEKSSWVCLGNQLKATKQQSLSRVSN